MGNRIKIPQKTKNRITLWSSSSTLGYISEESKSANLKRHMHINVHNSINFSSVEGIHFFKAKFIKIRTSFMGMWPVQSVTQALLLKRLSLSWILYSFNAPLSLSWMLSNFFLTRGLASSFCTIPSPLDLLHSKQINWHSNTIQDKTQSTYLE